MPLTDLGRPARWPQAPLPPVVLPEQRPPQARGRTRSGGGHRQRGHEPAAQRDHGAQQLPAEGPSHELPLDRVPHVAHPAIGQEPRSGGVFLGAPDVSVSDPGVTPDQNQAIVRSRLDRHLRRSRNSRLSTRATRLVSDRAVNMSITGLVLLFLPSVPLGAQITGAFERLHRIEGLSPISMGWSVAGAGDVNRDGFDDVIVGARGASRVYSGADGSMLWELTGGDSVAGVGDVNKDGFDDVMTGNGPFNLDRRTSAFVYSGLDGTVLWEFRGRDNTDHSQSVSGAGDVNGDGFQDMIIGTRTRRVVGEERIDYAGAAYVYSGQDGTLLWEFLGQAQADQLGYSVAGAGDIDQDGFDDVLVGIPYDDPGGLNEAGSAIVYSGKDGTVLRSFNGDFNDTLGFSVAGAGDVNKDGVPDVIVGAPGANTFNRPGFAIVYPDVAKKRP